VLRCLDPEEGLEPRGDEKGEGGERRLNTEVWFAKFARRSRQRTRREFFWQVGKRIEKHVKGSQGNPVKVKDRHLSGDLERGVIGEKKKWAFEKAPLTVGD